MGASALGIAAVIGAIIVIAAVNGSENAMTAGIGIGGTGIIVITGVDAGAI
jgi:hypothetical protein